MRLLILSLCGVVCERLLPCRVVVTAKWVVLVYTDYVYPAFVLLLADITNLPPLSFQKVLLFSLSFPLLFHHAFFLFYLWLIGHFVPAC